MLYRDTDYYFDGNDEKVFINPRSLAFRLWLSYRDRVRLAELGYTADLRTESTLLTDAFVVIRDELDRLREADRPKK